MYEAVKYLLVFVFVIWFLLFVAYVFRLWILDQENEDEE